MEPKRYIHRVDITRNYIDFYYNGKNPTRVEGCTKYKIKLNNFINDMIDEIESEWKQTERNNKINEIIK